MARNAERKRKRPFLQRATVDSFRIFEPLDSFRVRRPALFSLCCSVLVSAIVTFLLYFLKLTNIPDPPGWNILPSFAHVLTALLGIALGFTLTHPVARYLVPALIYVPQSIALRELGIVRVATELTEVFRLYRVAIAAHDAKEKVKVICITGRYLFVAANYKGDTEKKCPLHDLATNGKLLVIMPKSDPTNVTLREHLETFDDEFRVQNGLRTVEDYVAYVDKGKQMLLTYNNKVYEHEGLCDWRVVVFTEHCIVQSYFPNRTKGESFEAPAFLFAKEGEPDCGYTFYNVFSDMFERLWRKSKPALLTTLPVTLTSPPPD